MNDNPPSSNAKIRKATLNDVDSIYDLIDIYVKKEILLPRTKEDIASRIETTWIVELKGKVVATATLVPYGKNLLEIRALAVKDSIQKQGFGSQLVDYICKEYKKMHAEPVTFFALTYAPSFFIKLGMRVVEKERFPDKIFEVCMFCPRLDDCTETALEMVL